MRYSPERREAVLKKMLAPHNRSIRELAQEEGISEPTLYNWRKEARGQGRLLPDAENEPRPLPQEVPMLAFERRTELGGAQPQRTADAQIGAVAGRRSARLRFRPVRLCLRQYAPPNHGSQECILGNVQSGHMHPVIPSGTSCVKQGKGSARVGVLHWLPPCHWNSLSSEGF